MAKRRKKVTSRTGRETKAGFVSADIDAPDIPDYVLVELRYESPVAYTRTKFSAPAAAAPQADVLNDVLAKYDIQTLRSHFGLPSPTIKARVEVGRHCRQNPNRRSSRRRAWIRTSFKAGSSRSYRRRAVTRRGSRES